MKNSHKGEKSYWFGKHLTYETKEKLSISKMGGKSFCFGKFGRDHPSFGFNGKPTLNTETGVFYETIREASNSIGMKWETLRKKLSGKLKNTTPLLYV